MNKGKQTPKLKVIPLGGLGEIGKNMTVMEYGDDIIVIDCGLSFPDEDMYGVDLVIPDMTYLEDNFDRIRGFVITHGHDDHIGAVPFALQKFDVPVYGSRFTLALIEHKLEEHKIKHADLRTVKAGDTVELGCFKVEFIKVSHSIAGALAAAITTPVGVVIHTLHTFRNGAGPHLRIRIRSGGGPRDSRLVCVERLSHPADSGRRHPPRQGHLLPGPFNGDDREDSDGSGHTPHTGRVHSGGRKAQKIRR